MLPDTAMLQRSIFSASVILLFMISVNSCKPRINTSGPKPELFLSEQQMIDLITDFSLAEAGINYKRNTNKPTTNFKEPLFSLLLEKHGITLKIFEDNLNWYNKSTETIERIYDQALKNLEEIKAKAASEKEEAKNNQEQKE